MNPREIQKWILNLQRHVIFFDGSSKGDPWEAGEGGILLDPGVNTELTFSCVLERVTNSQYAHYTFFWYWNIFFPRNKCYNWNSIFPPGYLII